MFNHDSIHLDSGCADELRSLLAKFENKREALLTCLDAVQRRQHSVSKEAAIFLAKQTGTSPAEVYGVMTFYHMLSEKRLGNQVLRVCDCLTCHIKGGPSILEALKEELGIEIGETTKDGKVTLLKVPCMGLCDIAPAIMVNELVYGDLTPERVKVIAVKLKAGIPQGTGLIRKPCRRKQGSKVIS